MPQHQLALFQPAPQRVCHEIPHRVLSHKRTQFIYFITDEAREAVKIGITTDVGKRAHNLQTSHPSKLTVLYFFLGTIFDERRLHHRFAAFRLEGEWFQFDTTIAQFIEDEKRSSFRYLK